MKEKVIFICDNVILYNLLYNFTQSH